MMASRAAHYDDEHTRTRTLNRIASYPLVQSLTSTAKWYYDGAKDYSPMLKTGLETVESTVGASIEILDSYSHKYDPLIAHADLLAFRGLDTIEDNAQRVSHAVTTVRSSIDHTVHAIVEPVQAVVTPVRATIDQTVHAVTDPVKAALFSKVPNSVYSVSVPTPTEALATAVTYANDKVSGTPLLGGLLKGSVSVVDRCVDVLLPPTQGEGEGDANGASSPKYSRGSILDQTFIVQRKIQERATLEALLQVPRHAITGVMDLTPFTAHLLSNTTQQVARVKMHIEHTTQNVHRLTDMIHDLTAQRTKALTRQVIAKVHQSFDHVFAILMNMIVLLSPHTHHGDPIQAIQALARMIVESKEALKQSVNNSQIVERLRLDTVRILSYSREMVSDYAATLKDLKEIGDVNFERIKHTFFHLEDTILALLGNESPVITESFPTTGDNGETAENADYEETNEGDDTEGDIREENPLIR